MQTHIARILEDIKDIEQFNEGDTWKHAREFLSAAREDPFADHLRWWSVEGRPVACVQVFLHRYAIGCAKVEVCLPEYPFVPPELRGRGYFKRLMADLFEWLRGAGCPLAYDHGGKGLYTPRGYAPCFHHCMVLIRVADAAKIRASGRARAATDADVTAHEAMFRKPFPFGRGMQCRDERWRPEVECLRLVDDGDGAAGGVHGFVVLGEVITGRTANGGRFADFKAPEQGQIVTITDCWAADVPTAATLLFTVAREAAEAGFEWIRINCRREDPLGRLAVLAGGQLRWSAGQERDWTADGEDVDAFYLTDLRLGLEQLLPELNTRWSEFAGRAPSAIRLSMGDEEAALGLRGNVELVDGLAGEAPCVVLPRKAMTRAIVGYAAPTELACLHEGCEIPAACREMIDALLPAREPHLIHENSAFCGPEQFGLVP